MAVRLGYGGLANTNGARDFSGKTTAEAVYGSQTINAQATPTWLKRWRYNNGLQWITRGGLQPVRPVV